MKKIDWKKLTKRRALSFGVMTLGIVVTLAPIFFGGWVIALLGIALIAASLLQFVETFRSDDEDKSLLSYAAGVVTTLLGGVLFLSPNIAVAGLRFAVTLFFVFVGDGAFKLYAAYKQTGQERRWSAFNGLFTIALGCLIWFFITAELGILAIGVILGLRLIVEGWTMIFLPEKDLNRRITNPMNVCTRTRNWRLNQMITSKMCARKSRPHSRRKTVEISSGV